MLESKVTTRTLQTAAVAAFCFMIYLIVLLADLRAEHFEYIDKCEKAGGTLHMDDNTGRRCIKPDAFIEL